jgi:hypothetical protein
MCKFGLVAAAVVVGVGFGWIASTKARVAPPMMSSGGCDGHHKKVLFAVRLTPSGLD